jgi:hypothetical protein
LIANGPIVRADPFSGCRGFGEAFPGDVGAPICVAPDDPTQFDCVVPNNIDFYAVTANALSNTLPGTYFVDVCGEIGTLVTCQRVTLVVVQPPQVTQLHWTHSVSISHGATVTFTTGAFNPDAQALYMQAVVTGVGDNGHKFTATSAVFHVTSGQYALGWSVVHTFTAADAGHTFTFTVKILVGTTPTCLTASGNAATSSGQSDFDDSNQSSGAIIVTL